MSSNKAIRICQMSDLHYSGKNLAESERCFSYAVDQAIDLGADCVVISGDSTDHALDAHSPAFVALARNAPAGRSLSGADAARHLLA